MTTETLEKSDTKKTDNGPEVFHYVDKDKVVESAVTGSFVKALCGKIFQVTKVPKKGSPICPPCKEIYERMEE